MILRLLLFSLFCLTLACSSDDRAPGDLKVYGSGDYNFIGYPPFVQKPVKCFYYIPQNADSNSPIFMAVHGAGRNGAGLRNALIEEADQRGFIVLAPQFSTDYFPGSNAFNLANIFTNGDHPSPQSLRPEEEQTFRVFDPLFLDFRNFAGSAESRYDIFGHSAGAQLMHRFLQIDPDAGFNRMIASAAGWYMVPDPQIDFPYGQGISPAAHVNPAHYFERIVYVVVGEDDTDPDSFNLRHTPGADAQGLHRAERAVYFFERSQAIADSLSLDFRWNYRTAPATGHNSGAMARFSSRLLY